MEEDFEFEVIGDPTRPETAAASSKAGVESQPSPTLSFLRRGGALSSADRFPLGELTRRAAVAGRGALSTIAGIPADFVNLFTDVGDIVAEKGAQLIGLPKPPGSVKLPGGSAQIAASIDQVTGGALKPRDKIDDFIDLTASFFGVGSGLKAARTALRGATGGLSKSDALKELTSSVGAAGGAEIGEEAGGLPGAVVGSLIGGGALAQAGQGGSLLRRLGRSVAETSQPQEGAETLARLASNEKITLPSGALINNSFFKSIESGVAGKLSKPQFTKLMDELGGDFNKRLKQNLNSLSASEFDSRLTAGESARRTILSNEERLEKIKRERFSELDRLLQGVDVGVGNLSREAGQLSKKLRRAFRPSETQQSSALILDELGKELNTFSLIGKGQVPLERLIAQEVALNDIINWEQVGGARELLKSFKKKLTDTIDEEIGKIGRKDIAQARQEAKSSFKDLADSVRNDFIQPLIQNENPELLIQRFNSPNNVRLIKNALGSTPQGKEAFNSLARFKVEEMLQKAVNPTTGEINLQAFAKNSTKEEKALLKELMPPDQLRSMENLKAISQGIPEGLRKLGAPPSFANDPSRVNVGAAMIHAIASGNAALISAVASPFLVFKLLGRLATDKEFLKGVNEAAAAGRAGSAKRWDAAWKRIMPVLSQEVVEADEAIKQVPNIIIEE